MGNENLEIENVLTKEMKLKLAEELAMVVPRNVTDSVLNSVQKYQEKGELNLPPNYSVGNALKTAYFKIKETKDKNSKLAEEVCTPESVSLAILDMVVLGLNPAKSQGYFIVYGTRLSWFTSYFGNMAIAKRLPNTSENSEPIATIIYEGDTLDLEFNELGEEVVTKHKTSWENKSSGKISGAYATFEYNGVLRSAVMTYEDIKSSWGGLTGGSKEKSKFKGEFSKRTILNRLLKPIIQSTDDSGLLGDTAVRTNNQHFDFEQVGEETDPLQSSHNYKTIAQSDEPKEFDSGINEDKETPIDKITTEFDMGMIPKDEHIE